MTLKWKTLVCVRFHLNVGMKTLDDAGFHDLSFLEHLSQWKQVLLLLVSASTYI